MDSNNNDGDENGALPLWFSSRLGRKKRNIKNDLDRSRPDQDLLDLLEAFEDAPIAIVAINGNEKLVCKNLKGKPLKYL